jgi:hypothetical protein
MSILPFLFDTKSRSVFISTHLTVILLAVNPTLGQDVIFSNTITGTYPNTYNPYSLDQITNTNLTALGIGRGTGISGSNANDRYSAKGWNSTTINPDDYFTFTLAPTSSYRIDFTSFTYSGQASPTGPTSVALRSSIDNFVTDIGTPTIAGTTISLTATAFQNIKTPIEFRLYAWGATKSGGTFSINDFSFSGNVVNMGCAVPDAAGSISGPSTTIPRQQGVAYFVAPIANATNYQWSLPVGATVASGSNTNTITVNFGESGGDIQVRGVNACGDGAWSPAFPVVVTNPIIYLHNFGTTEITSHPYTDAPITLANHLVSNGWTNSRNTWTSYNRDDGEAIGISNSSGTPTITLSLTIEDGFQLAITHFNFWRQRSATGAPNWEMTINGTVVGNGTTPTTGNYIGKTSVSNTIENLSGTVLIVLTLSGASGSGTFRFDDVTLYGVVTCTTPTPDDLPDVQACREYILPQLTVGNYFTGTGGTGERLFAGDEITTSQTVYVYAETGTQEGCHAETSFNITILPAVEVSITLAGDYSLPVCPQLLPDQGFNPENSRYNAGSTLLKFDVNRVGGSSAWSFNYVVTGGVVNTSHPPFYPATGIISLSGTTESFETSFYIDNSPGTIQTLVFSILKTTNTENGCVVNYTDNQSTVVIKAMPVVGSFN